MNSDTKVSHMPILESFGMIDFKRPHKINTTTNGDFLDAQASLDFKFSVCQSVGAQKNSFIWDFVPNYG